MFRFDLNINYGCVEEMAIQSDNLHSALNRLITAVDRISTVIDANKGLAAEELKSKYPEITEKIAKIDVGVQKSANLLRDFKDTMTGIIAPLTEGVDLRVNVNDSMNKCSMMSYDLQEILNYVSSLDTDVGGSFLSVDVSSNKYEQMQIANKELDMIKEQLISMAKNLYSTYSDDIEKYRKIIEEYGQADSDFESKAQTLYNDYADVKWWQTNTAKIIGCAVLVAGCVALIVFAGPIAATITAGMASAGLTMAVSEGVVAGIGISGLVTGGADLIFGTTSAIINKEDLDTVMVNSLRDGIVVGMISSGVGSGITFAGNKLTGTMLTKMPQYSQTINKVAPTAVKYASNVVGDTSGNVVNNIINGDDADVKKTFLTEAGNGGIDLAKDKVTSEVFETVRNVGRDGRFNKIYNKGVEIANEYVVDGVKSTYENILDNILDGKEISVEDLNNMDDYSIDSSHVNRFTPDGKNLEDILEGQINKMVNHRRRH